MATESVSIIIKAFDQTQKALRGIKRAFAGLSKIFFNFKTALVAAVGAGGMGLLIANSLKATDALAKTAGKIGTTTEALSALQYAGQLTGVEVNTMNMALQRFTRRASEAAVGTGEAKGAIRELGIDARELVRLPLDQKMLVLADAFSEVQNESDRLRLAFKLFDSEGAALVNTLAMGRDGLDQMLGEAKSLGVVMTADAAKGVENANDAMTRMFAVSKGLVAQFTAALAPAIKFAADELTNFSSSLFDSEGGVREFAINAAANFIEFIAATIHNFERFAKAARLAFNGVITAANFIMPVFDVIGTAFDLLINGIKRKLNLLVQGTKLIDSALKKLGFDEVFNFEEFDLEPIEFTRTQLEKIGEVNFSSTYNGLRLVAGVVRETTNAATETGEALNNIKVPTAFESFIENLRRTRDMAGDLTPELEKLADQAITGLGKSFTDAITGAQKFSDAIKNMAKSVIDSLIQMLVQKYIVDAAFGAITGAIGGGTTPPVTGGGGGMSLGGLARGGVATGNTPYIVGEKGPELFIPSTTGRVVPNNDLSGGGVTVVQNINVTTGVQQTVRAEIANLLPQISNAAKSAVADARMRGGGFSKAMVGA
jgi:hypothetical protein